MMMQWLTPWLAPARARLDQLSERDRRALSVLSLLAGVLLLWFALIAPVLEWRAAAAEELASARETYTSLVTKAPRALSGSATATTSTASLNTELRRQANRYGLSIQSFEPDGDALRVRISEGRYSKVVQWLAALSAQGFVTEQLTLEGRNDPGLVSVLAVLSR